MQPGTFGNKTFYDVLGVLPSATDDEIKKAYHKLARSHHPDAKLSESGETEILSLEHLDLTKTTKFKMLTLAYNTLKNHELRRQYDQSLKNDEIAKAELVINKEAASRLQEFRNNLARNGSDHRRKFTGFGARVNDTDDSDFGPPKHTAIFKIIRRHRNPFTRFIDFLRALLAR